MRRRLHQRTGSLLALFAMLLITFAPMVSQLLAAHTQANPLSAELCSAHAASGADTADHPTHDIGHADGAACGYCHFFAHVPVLASANAQSALIVPVQRTVVMAASRDAPVSAPFSHAQPRAPPVLG